MKRLLLLTTLLFSFTACEKNSEDAPLLNPNYSIEGKWLFEVDANLANTMYEFKDGLRYTYYADSNDISTEYWNSLNTSDAIPNPNNYTFEDGILTIDLNFGNIVALPLILECDGNRINFQDPNSPDRYDWIRLGANVDDCN